MDKQNRLSLRSKAWQCLAGASCSPSRLIMIHTGVILLLSLLLTVADYLLEQQIGGTGGLGGIGSRSFLITVQTVLQLAQAVLLPFWQMGYVYVTMKLAREEAVSPTDLLEGFRRFGPVLRLTLLKAVITVCVAMFAANIASSVFLMTPFAVPMLEVLAPVLADPSTANDPVALQEAILAASGTVAVPLTILVGIAFLALGAPVFYRYRMASYFLLDSETPRAFAAMRSSRKLMRFLCLDMFKLDAGFWWFYLLELLTLLLGYGDLLLNALGIVLPFSTDGAYFFFFGLYLVSSMALSVWRRNHVEVTYACTYEFLRSYHDPKQPPKPKKQPWVY